jgi:hypothetical protein
MKVAPNNLIFLSNRPGPAPPNPICVMNSLRSSSLSVSLPCGPRYRFGPPVSDCCLSVAPPVKVFSHKNSLAVHALLAAGFPITVASHSIAFGSSRCCCSSRIACARCQAALSPHAAEWSFCSVVPLSCCSARSLPPLRRL